MAAYTKIFGAFSCVLISVTTTTANELSATTLPGAASAGDSVASVSASGFSAEPWLYAAMFGCGVGMILLRRSMAAKRAR